MHTGPTNREGTRGCLSPAACSPSVCTDVSFAQTEPCCSVYFMLTWLQTCIHGAHVQADVLPDGVVNTLAGGNELGQWMTEHPGFDKISFTGESHPFLETTVRLDVAARECVCVWGCVCVCGGGLMGGLQDLHPHWG